MEEEYFEQHWLFNSNPTKIGQRYRTDKGMNNFEKIKSMTLDEMAEFLIVQFDQFEEHFGCYSCINYGTHHHNPQECGDCEYYTCGGNIKQWLQQESEG